MRAAAAQIARAALLALAACGGGAAAPSAGPPAWLAPGAAAGNVVTSGSALERFFPLVDGTIYHYVTENDAGERGMLVARVARASATSGELRFPTGVKRFSFTADGVVLEAVGGPVHMLKAPIAEGASFRGEHGGTTRIVNPSAAVDVPAGHFDGCIQTLEERGGDRPVRYATTFCPGVGVVLLEAASGASFERAALKSYGAPVQMKPDGLERIPAGEPGKAPSP